jgi:hypothetical protein
VKRLAVEVKRILEETRRISKGGCQTADWLQKELTPARLQDVQDALRSNLLWTEARLQKVNARRIRRKPRLSSRIKRNPALKEVIAHHLSFLQGREQSLQVQRSVLRQIGDALAWLVLRADPRLIAPLSAKRTHHMPEGVGLVGQVHFAQQIHATGQFLVIENDLTRCLGIGDLTVVGADGHWVRPLPLEVKSKGMPVEGAKLDMEIFAAVSNHPADSGLHQAFSSVFAFHDPVQSPSPAAERQSKEILTRSELLGEVTGRIQESIPPPRQSLWAAVNDVLTKALTEGSALDFLGEGIVAVGVRTREGDDFAAKMNLILQQLRNLGFVGSEKGLVNATIEDLREQDSFAAYVPPIALWRLPLDVRAALLAGELFYSCVYHPSVWEKAMARHGLDLRTDGEEWTVQLGSESAHFDALEVRKLTLGVIFAGVQPTDVADRIAETLSKPKEPLR